MFRIDTASNSIQPIREKKFSELGFQERAHLQEWLASYPEALGEELLIIQKEFDGFDNTRERLDLLALDKQGQLVVIENKLDDSGRDVTWQAIKYASYCSSLSKTQIVNIYQSYLNRYESGGDARSLICDFYGGQELDELLLNPSNRQRIMLVAANFRMEVTSSALWLAGHGVDITCFKVTPFQHGEELLLNVEQIIPTPETADLMIGISAKEADQKNTAQELKLRHQIRLDFWPLAIEALEATGDSTFSNISPSKDHWISAGSGVRSTPYNLIFGHKEIRVELYISRASQEENKVIFDYLYAQKAVIEATFGSVLEWQRLDNKKASRISYRSSFDGYDKSNWPEMLSWFQLNFPKFKAAVSKHLHAGAKKIK